jgi:universal stress protein A
MTFKNILCPIDFSDGSREAMHTAAKLAAESDGQVVLVHVWHPPYVSSSELSFSDALTTQLRVDAEAQMERCKAELEASGARCASAEVMVGTPWDRIVERAGRDLTIDLIVIGTHGRTGIKRALLGSVAEKVVRHAPCPVLVVRSR